MENKKQPAIRFPEFTDDWEQRKLTDIVDRVNLSSNSNELPKVEFEDIAAGEGRLNKDVTEKLDSRKGTIFQPNNILYGKLRPYLKNWLQPNFKGIALGDFWVFEAKNTDAKFDYYLIQADKYQKVANDTSGTKMPRSDWRLVSNTSFLIPKKDEQTQIGSFFKQLDDAIALHQRKLELLKQTKQGCLQKMFPKEGAKVPEIRFPEFANDWELRKLDEIFNILDGDRGKNYPSDKDFLDNGATLFLDTGNIKKNGFNFTIKKFILKEKDEALRSGKLKLHDFILTSRGTLGNVAYYDEETFKNYPSVRINSAMLILRPILRNEVSDYYMASVLRGNVIDNFMSKNRVGSAQPHITKRDFSKIEIMIPTTIGEQQQIGTFFKQLDDTIALHQRELELLKETKKGFLQKLFV